MNSSKNRILDAAETIVLRDGASRLTLDAVAQETQMSKGGVLYHFPSKDELIRGMIQRLQNVFDAEVARFKAEDACPTGRTLRAMLNASFPDNPNEDNCRIDRIAAALIAAVATNPSLLEGMKEYTNRVEAEILNDGLDPAAAMVIHLAADGIWLSHLFGIPHPYGELRRDVLARLKEMTRGAEVFAPVPKN